MTTQVPLLKVHVTKPLINWALQQTSTACAIALALKNVDDEICYARVDQDTIRFTDRRTNTRYVFKTPPRLAAWIDSFDRDREGVRPINFTLDLGEPLTARPVRRLQPSQLAHQAEAGRERRSKGTPANPALTTRNGSERPLR